MPKRYISNLISNLTGLIRAQYIFLRAYKDVQKEKTAIDYLCLRRLDHWKGETHRWQIVRRMTDR